MEALSESDQSSARGREERFRHQQGARALRLQEQEQDLYAESASWKLLAALHGIQDPSFPGGQTGGALQGFGKEEPTKQKAASVIASDPGINRYCSGSTTSICLQGCIMSTKP